jgi:hypothetical protein
MELYLRSDELDGALSKVKGARESSLSVLRGLLTVFRGLAVFHALPGGVTGFLRKPVTEVSDPFRGLVTVQSRVTECSVLVNVSPMH